MKLFLEIFILPVCFGLLITWGIFGLDKGSGVYDDYAWIIGVVISIAGINVSSKFSSLQRKIDELESRFKK